jgi:hypothetical protein
MDAKTRDAEYQSAQVQYVKAKDAVRNWKDRSGNEIAAAMGYDSPEYKSALHVLMDEAQSRYLSAEAVFRNRIAQVLMAS